MGKLGTLLQIGRTFGLRDGMLRLGYELQRGGGMMSRRMQSAAGWDRWDLQRIAPNVLPEDLLSTRREGSRPFFFQNSRTLAPKLKKVLGSDGKSSNGENVENSLAANSVYTEAGNILQGTLPYFGRLSFACGFPPNWFQNPATGQRVSPDRSWTGMRFASPDYGDLKFILELSRFLFVYPLARAYALSGDERFPEAFWNAIEDWARHNPPMSGPLWICGQESSLRILAFSFALYAFLHSPATTPRRVALLLSMIAAHAWRTEQTLGYARSQRSNHLFSEAVGLWTAGTLYPELKRAAKWQKQGARLLSEAVRDQITPEGAFLQYSFNYQRMVLHQLLWTLRLADIHHIQLEPEIRARTEACLEFIRHFVDDESGHAPNYGSNDGTNILPLAACDFADYRPLLQLGACVLRRPSSLNPGPWDEPALWLCGASPAIAERAPARPVSPASGYHRIGREKSWAMVRASSYERRPFQADQLHVDLWWHGLNLARDPGTYLYNGEPPWNNGLAGTAVHNTVMVDRRDQMRRASRFLWLDWAQASGKSFSATLADSPDCFEGEHNGYRRMGVRHRRMVRGVEEDAWVIVDDLISDKLGAAEHDLRLHWLVPDMPFEVDSHSSFSVVFTADQTRVHGHVSSSSPGIGALIRAGKRVTDPIKCGAGAPARENIRIRHNVSEDEQWLAWDDEQLMGWESPTYGERRPAISIVYQVQARLPVRFITVLLAGESIQLRSQDGQLELWRGDSRIHQVPTSPPFQDCHSERAGEFTK